MKRISVREAARMMECGTQQIRMMIQLGKIPGAFSYGSKPRRTYFITDEQIKNLKRGGIAQDEE